jgi:hypothetical protein
MALITNNMDTLCFGGREKQGLAAGRTGILGLGLSLFTLSRTFGTYYVEFGVKLTRVERRI